MSNKNALVSALAIALLPSGSYAKETTNIESPSPVSVISREEIDRMGVTSVTDIITSGPFIDQGGRSTTGTGGSPINMRGLDDSDTIYLVNGQRVGHGGQNVAGVFDPAFIDRIEVLRGPQGTLFGSNSVGGVINIVPTDTYQGQDVKNSWVLNDLNNALGDYTFAIESNEDCDATHGSEAPYWTFSKKWDTGLPKVSSGGDFWVWGDKTDGYVPGSITGFKEKIDLDPQYSGLFGPYTFDELNRLLELVKNDPTASDQDKSNFYAALGMVFGLGGFGGLSDQSAAFGQFDADQYYKDFQEFVRTGGDGANSPSVATPAPAIPSTPPAAETPAESTPAEPAAKEVANPFDRYPYPPDYSFDFSQCTDEQRTKVLDLIERRDRGRAFMSSYADYLRGDWESVPKQNDDDPGSAEEAREMRDTNNEALREYWQACTNPAAPTQSTATEPAATDSGRWAARDNWNLEVHLEYDREDAKKPDADIGFELYKYGYGEDFKLPFSYGAEYDYDPDAGLGSSRSFFNDDGVVRIENGIKAPGLDSRFRLKVDVSGETDGGIKFGSRIDFSEDLPERNNLQGSNDDWQYFLDYDFERKRGGPTIGLKFNYTPVDSVFQEYVSPPEADPPVVEYQPDTKAALEYFDDFGGKPFSFGGRSFRTFTAPEISKPDWRALDNFPGQTYWAEDQCDDSALPGDGSGYLTAEQSSVKSVADQWAFEHVGLDGDEPSLDEFAKPVIIGVIDTGIDWNHRDFSWDNLWQNDGEIPDNGIDDDGNGFVDDLVGWNFTGENNRPWDRDGHGTAVAGIIAATQGNGIGIDGINGHAKIMVLKALNNFGRTRATYIARAIVYGADNGAQILNLSVTGPGFPKIVQDAVDYAESKGVLVVNAAGNNAEDIDSEGLAPLQRVLTVAATGPDDKRAVFSNVGDSVSLAAPGVDIVSLRARRTDFMYSSGKTSYVKEDAFIGEDRRYYRATGTSFATPIVTGVASLLLANNPGLSPADLRRVLEQSARDVEAPGRDRYTGYGIVDVRGALSADPAYFIEAAIAAVDADGANGQRFLSVFGTADANQLDSASFDIGEGVDPASWAPVSTPIVETLEDGELAQIPVELLAGAPTWTIRLTVRHQDGTSRETRYIIDL